MHFVRTLHLALCALVLLGLTGCSEEEVPPICSVAPAPAPPPTRQGLLKVGQKFILPVMPLLPLSCGVEAPQRPTSVTAEIEGPGGEPLEGQVRLGSPNAPAILEFTPVRPGPHHVLVAFSQVGGIHQFDFQAVVDSSTSAPSFTVNRPCSSLERTQQGAWVCDTAVLRGETVVRTFPSARLAVAGDVLWAVAPGGVERYVDTGTDLVFTGSLLHSEGAATFLQASADELAVVHDHSLALYTFSGGTLATAGATPWTRPSAAVGSPGPYGVILRDGEHLAVVTRESVNFQGAVQVCPYQLVSGKPQRTSGTCTQIIGDTVGFEPRVLWTREPPTLVGNRIEQGVIHRWEWTAGRLASQGLVSLGVSIRLLFPPLLNPSNVPVVQSDVSGSTGAAIVALPIWSPERQLILFEHLDAAVLQPRASPTFYWGGTDVTSTEGATRVRERPRNLIP
ncbi:MAG TPA: hypothetical protein VF815_01420 [Myxococcaceae bacterium]|jgi:hypothetical protein